MFDVNTMNGSRVTAKMAGMESIANTRSLPSIATSTSSRGVATHRPFSRTANRAPL